MPGRSRAPSRLLHLVAAVVAVSLGTALPVAADDVYLTNGSVFQGVETETTDTHVIVRLQIGQLSLPAAQVRRVVESEVPYVVFAERKRTLLSEGAPAAEFAALARWALGHELRPEGREALLIAARLDPRAPGLAPLMTEMGYELDAEQGWITRARAMERRGLVEFGGDWMTPSEADLRRREREVAKRVARLEAEERRRQRELAARAEEPDVSDNEVALASIDLAREVAVGSVGVVVGSVAGFGFGQPVLIPMLPLSGGGGMTVGPGQGDGAAEIFAAQQQRLEADWKALASRQPGSIIPLAAYRAQTEQRP